MADKESKGYEKTNIKISLDDTEKLDWTIPDLLDNPKNEFIQVIFKVDNPEFKHETFLSKVVSRANIDGIMEAMEVQGVDENMIFDYCIENTTGIDRYKGYRVLAAEMVVYSHK